MSQFTDIKIRLSQRSEEWRQLRAACIDAGNKIQSDDIRAHAYKWSDIADAKASECRAQLTAIMEMDDA